MNPQLEVKLYSIWPEEIVIQRAWQRYIIPAGSPEQPSELIVRRTQTDKRYEGNNRYSAHFDDAEVLAEDLVRDAALSPIGAKEGQASRGIWFSADDAPPTAEVIERQRGLRDAFLRFWLREGDRLYEQGKSTEIRNLSRLAADLLRENRTWRRIAASDSIKTCQFCGSDIPSLAVKCKTCGEVVDREAYNRMRGDEPAAAPGPPPMPPRVVTPQHLTR